MCYFIMHQNANATPHFGEKVCGIATFPPLVVFTNNAVMAALPTSCVLLGLSLRLCQVVTKSPKRDHRDTALLVKNTQQRRMPKGLKNKKSKSESMTTFTVSSGSATGNLWHNKSAIADFRHNRHKKKSQPIAATFVKLY